MSARFALPLLMALAGGCAAPVARLPYRVEAVPTAEAPAHPEALAVVRLVDARRPEEAPNRDATYVYRGVEYRGTALEQLGLSPTRPVTHALARHLAKARIFRRVWAVEDPAQAPSAELVLRGSLVRLRGYVEARSPGPDSGLPETARRVLAEVELGPLELRRADDPPRAPPMARFTVGWSFHDVRTATAAPWSLAAEALGPSLTQLTAALASADLAGGTRVAPVDLGRGALPAPGIDPGARLRGATPPGWRFAREPVGGPLGWEASAPCARGAWRTRQELGFSRRMGPYRPIVQLTWCAPSVALRWDARAPASARYVGRDAAGRRWFVRPVGRSSFERAPEQVAARFSLRAPALRHAFELGPGPRERGPGGEAWVPEGARPRRGAEP